MADVLMEDEVKVTLPEVNLRPGEERFKSVLQMDAAMRQESLQSELATQMRRMENTSLYEQNARFARSPSAKRRQIAIRKLHAELMASTQTRDGRVVGPCAPCTLINLNPVPLTLQGELQRWSVPSALDRTANLIELEYKGRKYTASYITFRTPHIYLVHNGATNDSQVGGDMPLMSARYVPPIGLAHQFYRHYVIGASDAKQMGGVIVFEGDIHTLTVALEGDGIIDFPKQIVTLDGMGDAIYTTERRALKQELAQQFEMQQRYAQNTIAEAHRYATSNSDIERNNLHNVHVTWHNWCLDVGYIKTPYAWASERLQDTPKVEAVYCPDCRTRQEDPEQYFCRECNAPFDALAAYLAGKNVSMDRLAVYDGEAFEQILKEKRRRAQRIAMLEEQSASIGIPNSEVAAEEAPRTPTRAERAKAAREAKAAKEAAAAAAAVVANEPAVEDDDDETAAEGDDDAGDE